MNTPNPHSHDPCPETGPELARPRITEQQAADGVSDTVTGEDDAGVNTPRALVDLTPSPEDSALGESSESAESPPVSIHEELERMNVLAMTYEKSLAVREDPGMRAELTLLRMFRRCLIVAAKRGLSDDRIASLREALTVEINRRAFFDGRIKTEMEYLNPAGGTVVHNAAHKKEALMVAQQVEQRRRRAWDKAWESTDLDAILEAAAAANDGVHEEDDLSSPSPETAPVVNSDSRKRSSVLTWAMRTNSGRSSREKSTKETLKTKPRKILTAAGPDDGPLPPHLQRLLKHRLALWNQIPIGAQRKHRPCGRSCVLIRGDAGHRCEHTKNCNIYKFLASLDPDAASKRKQPAPPRKVLQESHRDSDGQRSRKSTSLRSPRKPRPREKQPQRTSHSHAYTASSERAQAVVLGYTDV